MCLKEEKTSKKLKLTYLSYSFNNKFLSKIYLTIN